MPGHFTHIYTARRVADYLISGEFPDWTAEVSRCIEGRDPVALGKVMQKWEKFTAIGAIGPDLFYFNQDWNNPVLGQISDEIMLAFAVYYFLDAASEDDWEPLLNILNQVNSQLAALLRFLIKLDQIWKDFLAGWNATIGPVVSGLVSIADGLTGGVLSALGDVLTEYVVSLKQIAKEDFTAIGDIFSGGIFSAFDTCVQKGFGEKLFLWSDMSHYRRPSALCQAFVKQAEWLAANGKADEAEQFMAFTLGYITHLGTDTVAHSFVNEQCGGPYRDHPQRHHLIENHIDAWNYNQCGPGGTLPQDSWGVTDDYPSVSMSALWFAVQLTSDNPYGVQRPIGPWPDDATRAAALDVDGEMPDWMAEAIVRAMIDCYQDPNEHPQIMQGSAFQAAIDEGLLTKVFAQVTGGGLTKPFNELLDDICPAPDFNVPTGFPLPWEVKTMYKIMYTYYRLVCNGTWELQKPRRPDRFILPPASDFTNLLQPPDLSGVDLSNPVADVCGLIVALFEWVGKTVGAALTLIGDLIKMVTSGETYWLRLKLHDLAMMVWDTVTKTHELLAHTGFVVPHPAVVYADNGELRLPNEIDIPLITLGGGVDAAFLAAVNDASDPFGNLDRNQNAVGTSHSVKDQNYPYYPVLRYDTNGGTEPWEFRQPWAWPSQSPVQQSGKAPDTARTTPTETYNPAESFGEGPDRSFKPLSPGPYPAGSMPDVFFRLNAPVDQEVRSAYEQCQTPWETDQLNVAHLARRELKFSPIGDPIPFSAYLISQLTNETGYSTQFNLDSDRAFAYLTWDWIRDDAAKPVTGILGLTYAPPKEPPANAPEWLQGNNPLLLQYKDKPNPPDGPRIG